MKIDRNESLANPLDLPRDCAHVLPVQLSHLPELETLPKNHSDPFDRSLICRALTLDLTILTKDEALKNTSGHTQVTHGKEQQVSTLSSDEKTEEFANRKQSRSSKWHLLNT
jgi:hypothetical protein